MAQVSEHVERLVRLIKGDEGPETAASVEHFSHSEDDADNRIEEI
jgi:hypothetical protein